MKKYLLLLLVLALLSCDRQTDFEKKLIDSKWVYYPHYKLENKLARPVYIRFYDDGIAKNYYLDSDKEYKPLNLDTKGSDNSKWEYFSDDKKLLIYGTEFKVLSENDDTIRMYWKDHFKVLLFRIDKNKP